MRQYARRLSSTTGGRRFVSLSTRSEDRGRAYVSAKFSSWRLRIVNSLNSRGSACHACCAIYSTNSASSDGVPVSSAWPGESCFSPLPCGAFPDLTRFEDRELLTTCVGKPPDFSMTATEMQSRKVAKLASSSKDIRQLPQGIIYTHIQARPSGSSKGQFDVLSSA